MAIGCISEVFAACPAVIPQYFDDFNKILLANSLTGDSKLNRNVAYSIGVLAQHAQLIFQPHLASFTSLLEQLHKASETQEAKDNIVAAYSRIIEFQYMPLPVEQRPANFLTDIDSVF